MNCKFLLVWISFCEHLSVRPPAAGHSLAALGRSAMNISRIDSTWLVINRNLQVSYVKCLNMPKPFKRLLSGISVWSAPIQKSWTTMLPLDAFDQASSCWRHPNRCYGHSDLSSFLVIFKCCFDGFCWSRLIPVILLFEPQAATSWKRSTGLSCANHPLHPMAPCLWSRWLRRKQWSTVQWGLARRSTMWKDVWCCKDSFWQKMQK